LRAKLYLNSLGNSSRPMVGMWLTTPKNKNQQHDWEVWRRRRRSAKSWPTTERYSVRRGAIMMPYQ
jgi:hypothetical protein